MINIWLDDIRPAPEGFVWVKTVEDIIDLWSRCVFDTKERINTISLDNDLGEGIQEGYKFLDYIESRIVLYSDPLPNEIKVHSANPVARKRMNQIINKLYGRSC